jgi:hypothetical protein
LNVYTNFLNLSQKHIIKFLVLFFILIFPLTAQTKIDTLTSNKQDTVKFIMQKSPTGAMIRSIILPGFGQYYNESYWKIPVIWGFLGYFGYKAIDNNRLYNEYAGIVALQTNADLKTHYTTIRDFYRDNRDSFIVYMALTYLLNIVDSFVDAHLFDFDVSDTHNSMNYSLKLKIGL